MTTRSALTLYVNEILYKQVLVHIGYKMSGNPQDIWKIS